MPDVTLVVHGMKDAEEAERLERALSRLDPVVLVNADPGRSLVAVSYEGGSGELERIEQAVREAGYDSEPSPGAGQVEG